MFLEDPFLFQLTYGREGEYRDLTVNFLRENSLSRFMRYGKSLSRGRMIFIYDHLLFSKSMKPRMSLFSNYATATSNASELAISSRRTGGAVM